MKYYYNGWGADQSESRSPRTGLGEGSSLFLPRVQAHYFLRG
ncbi:hypothetical protein BC938DRAFT_473534 [Jimgerdemannia flammicorona]|uniref:Uncharacterized protein n=1 Tax=Jimgerdemannia flammicorona TaxID=994334 RepID=A0A433Q3Z5_9FUNG|nr:hypothetical protein BC938DRAFT_473534 [Jimgerdemannia flammicorona]